MPRQGSCLQFFDRTIGQNSVTNIILTEIVGQNFGQTSHFDRFRSKFFQHMPPHWILFPFFWPHNRSKFGHKYYFDRNFWSNQNFDRLSVKIFGHKQILTDCQSVEISVKILWPSGHNEISTHVFPTDRSRSKFRSKCTNSVKILGFFGQISVKINIRFCSIYAGSQTCYNCVVGNSHQW